MSKMFRTLALGGALATMAASSAMAQYGGQNGTYYDRLRSRSSYGAMLSGGGDYPYETRQSYGNRSYYQPGRTYSGQTTGFPPTGTPFYPGPRPSGPKSGGGGGGGM